MALSPNSFDFITPFKILILTALSFLYFSLPTTISATQPILFQDDFNDGNDAGWFKLHEQGPDTNTLWTVVSGMYGMEINTLHTIGNSLAGNEGWTDYLWEFDMLPITGADKNFMFRHHTTPATISGYAWYEVHVSGNDIYISKPGSGVLEDPSLPSNFPQVNSAYSINNGSIYNWQVNLQEEHIIVNVKEETETNYTTIFNINDSNNPYLNGRIGLRIGTGAVAPSEVYFDNIEVTDLSPTPTPTPTPTPKPYLDVPHFSQNDPAWKDDEYDHSSNHNPIGQQEIQDWGCALTSGAMILKYHGYTVGPDNQTTNPQTLNQYLIDKGGYTNNGGVIWSYFTQYGQQAKDSGNLANNPPSLEFEYSSYDTNTLDNDLNNNTPDIVKIVTDDQDTPSHNDDYLHFVVAKGYQDNVLPGENTIHINDPLDLTDTEATLSGEYAGLEYRQLGRFIPSNTDLSYIWIYLNDPNVELLVEHQGQKTGTSSDGQSHQEIPGALYFEEGIIANPNQGNISFGDGQHGARVFALPKPAAGNYHLTFSTNTLSQESIELHLFNTQADSHKIELSPILGSNTAEHYTLAFDPEADPTTTSLSHQMSFNDLQEAVNTAHELEWLDNHGHRKLSMFLTIIKRVPVNKPKPRLLKTFKNILRNMHRQGHLTDLGHQYLVKQTDLLLQTF